MFNFDIVDKMKVGLNSNCVSLGQVLKDLPASFSTLGDSIYKARNELRCFEYNGKKYVVKGYKVPHFINRIAYTYIRPSKAKRAYEYGLRLLSMGIDTPTPVGYVETYRHGLLHRSFFVSEYKTYPRMMREIENGGVEGREELLKAFVAYTARLHKKGVWHLDYSPGNILFDNQDGEFKFSILDLNRMRFTVMSRKQCLENFERISCNEEVFRYMIGEYARVRGWDEERSIAVAWRAHCRFWAKRK